MSDEDIDLVPEQELLELFRRRRPAPEAFRAGVERHIEERRRAAAERVEREKHEPLQARVLRRVAAMLPPDSLGGALVGSTAAKVAAAKLLPTVLALPALLLGGVLGAFAAGARSLARTMPGSLRATRTPDERGFREALEPANEELRLGARLIAVTQLVAFSAVFALTLFGGRWMTDALVSVLLISISALVASIRGLAREGWLSRDEVARLCANVLAAGLLAVVMFSQIIWYRVEADSDLGAGWAVGVIYVGAMVCTVVASRLGGARKYRAWLLFLLLGNPFGCTNSSPVHLRAELERLNDVGYEPWEAGEASALFESLSAGGGLPDLGPFALRINAAIEERSTFLAPYLVAARIGRIDAEHMRILAEICRGELDALWTVPQFRGHDGGELLVRLALATRSPSPAELEALTQAVERSWPVGPYFSLQKAAMCVRFLDLLGRGDLVEARRPAVHALLREHWVADRWALGAHGLGGFESSREARHSSIEDSLAALELMARLGVPEGIDLRLLHGYLRGESRVLLWPFDVTSSYKTPARIALLCLEQQIGLPPRRWYEHIIGERLLIAAVLVVALCLLAIRLAPPMIEARVGAQP